MIETIIHIGFPKTGSTYLQSYFESHPSIHHNRSRFNSYVNTGHISDEIIEELYPDEKIDILSEELLSIWSGDISKVKFQSYNMEYDFEIHQKNTAEQLNLIFPKAKILIVTRGFQSLFNSLYSQYILTGGTNSKKKFSKESEEIILKLYNYNKVIDLYSSLFSKDQLIVLPFEWLQENPNEFLIYLEKIFNIDHIEFDSNKIHVSIPDKLTTVIRINTFIYKKILSIIYKNSAQQKFLKYLEKIHRLKESKFVKIFRSRNKNLKVSEDFVRSFDLNSSYLNQLEVFNPYISKYRNNC